MAEENAIIEFACSGCGKPFSVPLSYAGRRATCKGCGAKVTVPGDRVMPASDPPVPDGANGKPHPAPTHGNWAPTPPVVIATPRTVASEAAVATSDPAQPTRRATQIAMISEAQSPPMNAVLAAPTLDALQPMDPPKPAVSSVSSANRPVAPGQSVAKVPVRTRRLLVDAEQMSRAFSQGGGPIRVKSAVGDPPEVYQVEYQVKGLQKGWLGKPKPRTEHLVEIQLTSEYPRVSPMCKMLTPVFHPNIDETTICVGDHWTAGARLVDLVIQIGEMLSYQAYNIKSPLNGEAAMWADLNADKLPIDSQNLHPGEP